MILTNFISKTILASAISISLWQLPVELFNPENNLISGSSAGPALSNHETFNHELSAYETSNHRPSSVSSQTAAPAVLVFSKTNGYRHKSIEAGKEAFKKLAAEKQFTVEFTEDSTQFNTQNLNRYKAVVFLNTTGNVLGDAEQAAFEKYIQSGRGYLGIHSATDCEYQWAWYGKLAGAYFLNHPGPKNVLNGKFYVVDKDHPATKGMPAEFERSDEFYSFKQINPDIKVLVKIDEKSYKGGKNGDDHPMSWYHDYDGGRAFYTAMGHTDETFSEPLFLNHMYAGLQYAMGK